MGNVEHEAVVEENGNEDKTAWKYMCPRGPVVHLRSGGIKAKR